MIAVWITLGLSAVAGGFMLGVVIAIVFG